MESTKHLAIDLLSIGAAVCFYFGDSVATFMNGEMNGMAACFELLPCDVKVVESAVKDNSQGLFEHMAIKQINI